MPTSKNFRCTLSLEFPMAHFLELDFSIYKGHMPPLICTPPRYQLPLLTSMATQSYVLSILMLGLVASNIVASTTPSHEIHSFNRHSFPPGFIFGTASAAYQVIFSLSYLAIDYSDFTSCLINS